VYTRMASEEGLDWADLAQLVSAVRSFVDPVLAGRRGVWDPAKWTWSDRDAWPDSNHENIGSRLSDVETPAPLFGEAGVLSVWSAGLDDYRTFWIDTQGCSGAEVVALKESLVGG
jgi:hypothetical protein